MMITPCVDAKTSGLDPSTQHMAIPIFFKGMLLLYFWGGDGEQHSI